MRSFVVTKSGVGVLSFYCAAILLPIKAGSERPRSLSLSSGIPTGLFRAGAIIEVVGTFISIS